MLILMKASIVIIIMLAFYKLFLEKESFFAANRFYLLGCLALACALPFLTLPEIIDHQGYISELLESPPTEQMTENHHEPINNIPVNHSSNTEHMEGVLAQGDIHPITSGTGEPDISKAAPIPLEANAVVEPKSGRGFYYAMFWIYIFGIIVLSINLIAQIGNTLWKIIKNDDKIVDDDGIIVNVHTVAEPCSFFKYIFINPSSYDYDTYEQIITHEKIHVAKRHCIDLLLSELAVILLWFNPFVWLLRKEVEKNIEYQTDDILVHDQSEVKETYQLNLVKIACHTKPLTITTNYNQSLIKQRLLKMNGKKSNTFNYWKYAFTLPLLIGLSLALNKPYASIAQSVDLEPDLVEEFSTRYSKSEDLQDEVPPITEKEAEQKLDSDTKKVNLEVEPEKIVNKQFIADCTEFEEAVASGDLNRVKEILKTLDPDCLKIKKNNRSNLKSVENLVQESKQKLENDDSATRVYSPCLAVNEAMDRRDFEELKRVLTHEDISCLNDVYGDPSDDIVLLQGLLSRGAEMTVDDQEVIKISDIGLYIDITDPYSYACQDPDYLRLVEAIKSKDEYKIRKILSTTIPTCPLNVDGVTNDFPFINELMKYKPEIINHGGHGISIFGIGLLIDLDLRLEKPKYMDQTNAKATLQDIEELLSPIQGALEQPSCVELVDAIVVGDYYLTKKLLEHVNPDCYHRETHTTTSVTSRVTTTTVTTPFVATARQGSMALARLLLGVKADVNYRVDEDESPLMAAVQSGNLGLVELLVENGAALNTKNLNNWTALDFAMDDKNEPILQYLKSKGAKANTH